MIGDAAVGQERNAQPFRRLLDAVLRCEPARRLYAVRRLHRRRRADRNGWRGAGERRRRRCVVLDENGENSGAEDGKDRQREELVEASQVRPP